MPTKNVLQALRPQFRLSTFFLAVGVLALCLGWRADHDRQSRRMGELNTIVEALHEALYDEQRPYVPEESPHIAVRYESVDAFLEYCFQTDLVSGQQWQVFWSSLESVKDTSIARESVPELVKLLRASDSQIRERAAAALGAFAAQPDVSLPALKNALHDPHHGVQLNAAISIGRFGPKAANASPALLALAKEGSPELQAAIARGLWVISQDPRAIDIATKLLRSEDTAIRCDAILILNEIGPPAQTTAPLLADLVCAEDAGTSLMAIEALLNVAPKEQGYQVLLAAFPEMRGAPRRAAALALTRLDAAIKHN